MQEGDQRNRQIQIESPENVNGANFDDSEMLESEGNDTVGDLLGANALSIVLKSETESIINQNRRISSVRRMNPQNQSVCERRINKVEKYSPALFAGWQPRLLEVNHRKLTYYKQEKWKAPVMAGILNFDMYRCSVQKDPKNK